MFKKISSMTILTLSLCNILQAQIQNTLSIIKPDAVSAAHIGEIIARFEKNNLFPVGLKMQQLTKQQAGEFYAMHKNQPFYNDLVNYMTSGPVVVMVLEGEEAVAKNREIMGATDPKKATPGTIRADFSTSITKNAVHGSDSIENAKREIDFFFSPAEIFHHSTVKSVANSGMVQKRHFLGNTTRPTTQRKNKFSS